MIFFKVGSDGAVDEVFVVLVSPEAMTLTLTGEDVSAIVLI